MSLTHRFGATARRKAVLMAAAMLCAATTIAAQVTTTTTSSGARARRSRCEGCSDSTRARHDALFQRFDSLRSEFERRRMSDVEREVLAREMTATLMALQEFMDVQIRIGGPAGTVVATSPRMRMDVERTNAEAAAAGAVPQGGGRARITAFGVTPEKQGYIGVTFAGPMLQDDGVQRIVRFLAYPEIASVDPSSPAERAGIVRGDTLLSLNGTDVFDRTFSFSRLLVPDARVTLTVRRRGDAKEFRVVVGETPSYVVRRVMPPAPPVAAEAPDAPSVVALPGVAVAPARVEARAPARAPEPTAPVARSLSRSPMPIEPPDAAFMAYPGRVVFIGNVVAGARLEVLSAANEDLGKALGASEGLLVMRVLPGTLAERSGLRGGDVILKGGDGTIRTVQDFQRVVADMDRSDKGVKIVVLRDHKKHDLVLK